MMQKPGWNFFTHKNTVKTLKKTVFFNYASFVCARYQQKKSADYRKCAYELTTHIAITIIGNIIFHFNRQSLTAKCKKKINKQTNKKWGKFIAKNY